jgi:hypothetical protein
MRVKRKKEEEMFLFWVRARPECCNAFWGFNDGLLGRFTPDAWAKLFA